MRVMRLRQLWRFLPVRMTATLVVALLACPAWSDARAGGGGGFHSSGGGGSHSSGGSHGSGSSGDGGGFNSPATSFGSVSVTRCSG